MVRTRGYTKADTDGTATDSDTDDETDHDGNEENQGNAVCAELDISHRKTGMQSLPTTFGKDDSRSHGDEAPTTRDIIQYPGLFYEHGDDFAVCHSGKKGQGARDFQAFTDILETRGATLAHDGRYFSTPKLERYIRNATVSTAELSFGLPLKCLPPKRLLMHVAEWAA
jgi:hypothetical protein